MSRQEQEAIKKINNELSDATERLRKLKLEINKTERKIEQLREQQSITASQKTIGGSRKLTVGDRVQVLDNYKGRKGKTGIITRVTASQVRIKADSDGEHFSKYKQNVRRIEK